MTLDKIILHLKETLQESLVLFNQMASFNCLEIYSYFYKPFLY